MSLPRVSATLRGRPVPLLADWTCSDVINGGFDRASAQVPADAALATGADQEDVLAFYAEDSIDPIWWGTLSQAPLIRDGIAQLEAEGPAAHAQRRARRLLFMTRDTTLFADADAEPHLYAGNNPETFGASADLGRILFTIRKGSDITTGHDYDVVMWAPGTPGGLTKISFRIRHLSATGSYQLRIRKSFGPSGSRTLVDNLSLAGFASTIQITPRTLNDCDSVSLGIDALGTVTNVPARYWAIEDLRLRGIATSDVFTDGQVIAWVFDQLGWDGARLGNASVDVMPLDWIGAPYGELMTYVATLAGGGDWYWLGPSHPDLTGGVYRKVGTKTWTVYKAGGSEEDVNPLVRYNRVVLPYTDVGGAEREVEADADPSPFREGIVKEFPADPLSDVQSGSTLPARVAQTLVDCLSHRRWAGSISVVGTRASSGEVGDYRVRPGDILREADAGPLEAREHVVTSVERTAAGVTATVDHECSATSLIDRDALRPRRPGAIDFEAEQEKRARKPHNHRHRHAKKRHKHKHRRGKPHHHK